MILRVDGRTYRGEALDCHGVDPEAVARAVRGDPSPVAVRCPDPGAVQKRVGVLEPGTSLSVRAALAAAARSRGLEAPQDPELRSVRDRIAALDPPSVDRDAVRRELAAAGDREDRLHERVAELRGRVRLLEDRDEEAGEARRRLREATAELSEARTERIAAEQRLDRLDERLRDARDDRERRLRLEDRRDNLRRAARDHLARDVLGEFRAALEAVPGEGRVGEDPTDYEGDPLTAALAVCRVADRSAPVVLACDRFRTAAGAADCLGPPVIRVPSRGG